MDLGVTGVSGNCYPRSASYPGAWFVSACCMEVLGMQGQSFLYLCVWGRVGVWVRWWVEGIRGYYPCLVS